MRDIRPQFTDEEYARLRVEADRLGVTLKQLVHARALGIAPEDSPLSAAKILCDEMAQCREVLNQIIRRETESDVRLFEDDIIKLELSMAGLERTVTAFVRAKLREAKRDG